MAFANPRVLYLNRGVGSTITSSSETSSFPDDNAVSWREYLKWRSTGADAYWIKFNVESQVTANAAAIVAHNAGTSDWRYKWDGSNNDSDWVEIVAYTTPGDDFTLADFFTEVTYQYFRLTIDNDSSGNFDLEVGIAFIGNYLEFPNAPEGSNDPDEQVDKSTRTRGETGRLLGVVNDWTARENTWTFLHLTQTWVDNTWIPYWNGYRFQPFIFSWNYLTKSSAVYLMEWSMDRMTAPYRAVWRSLTVTMRGVKEE